LNKEDRKKAIYLKRMMIERVTLIWLVSTVFVGVPCLLVASTLTYFAYGCWPLGGYSVDSCLNHIDPPFLKVLPMVIAVLLGTGLAVKVYNK